MFALLDGPRYPANLATDLPLARANVRNHLACLRGCGLVVGSPEGSQVRDELATPRLAHALGDLLGVVLTVEEEQPCLPIAHASKASGVTG